MKKPGNGASAAKHVRGSTHEPSALAIGMEMAFHTNAARSPAGSSKRQGGCDGMVRTAHLFQAVSSGAIE